MRPFSLHPNLPRSVDAHNGLNDAGLWLRVRWKHADEFIESRPMRDPGPRVDFPLLDQLDDPFKILRQRIAAGQKGQFATMHQWMAEAYLGSSDPHIDN